MLSNAVLSGIPEGAVDFLFLARNGPLLILPRPPSSVDLGVESKIRTIEETEAAKEKIIRKRMEEAGQPQDEIDVNYASSICQPWMSGFRETAA